MSNKLNKQPWQEDFTYVHVNQGNIKSNNKLRKQFLDGEITREEAEKGMVPCLTAKTTVSNRYGTVIVLYHPETGEEVGRFEQTPFDPYKCGAQIVFKTKMKVIVEG